MLINSAREDEQTKVLVFLVNIKVSQLYESVSDNHSLHCDPALVRLKKRNIRTDFSPQSAKINSVILSQLLNYLRGVKFNSFRNDRFQFFK